MRFDRGVMACRQQRGPRRGRHGHVAVRERAVPGQQTGSRAAELGVDQLCDSRHGRTCKGIPREAARRYGECMDVNVSATVKVRVTVNAEKWAATHGVEPLQASASLAGALSEALERFGDLVPDLASTGGAARVEKLTWTASSTNTSVPN